MSAIIIINSRNSYFDTIALNTFSVRRTYKRESLYTKEVITKVTSFVCKQLRDGIELLLEYYPDDDGGTEECAHGGDGEWVNADIAEHVTYEEQVSADESGGWDSMVVIGCSKPHTCNMGYGDSDKGDRSAECSDTAGQ